MKFAQRVTRLIERAHFETKHSLQIAINRICQIQQKNMQQQQTKKVSIGQKTKANRWNIIHLVIILKSHRFTYERLKDFEIGKMKCPCCHAQGQGLGLVFLQY